MSAVIHPRRKGSGPTPTVAPLVALAVLVDLRDILFQAALNHQCAPAKVPAVPSKPVRGPDKARDLDHNWQRMWDKTNKKTSTKWEPLPTEKDPCKKAWTPPREYGSQPIKDHLRAISNKPGLGKDQQSSGHLPTRDKEGPVVRVRNTVKTRVKVIAKAIETTPMVHPTPRLQ